MGKKYKVNLDYKFKGYDWNELIDALNLPKKYKDMPEDFKQLVWNKAVISPTKKAPHGSEYIWPKGEAILFRKFLKKLAAEEKNIGYNAPFFLGIMKIKDDETMMKRFLSNLEDLWT